MQVLCGQGLPLDEFMLKVIAAVGLEDNIPSLGSSPPGLDVEPQAAPASEAVLVEPSGAAASGSEGATAFFSQLSQLMSWRCQGLLSEVEFANAKCRLGLH